MAVQGAQGVARVASVQCGGGGPRGLDGRAARGLPYLSRSAAEVSAAWAAASRATGTRNGEHET